MRLLIGVDMCLPDENASFAPTVDKPIALEKGSRFADREGAKTVGSGVMVEVG